MTKLKTIAFCLLLIGAGAYGLTLAAAQRFGEQSPEFETLRKVYAHRLLQRSLTGTGRLAERLTEIDGRVQRLMFPGVTRDELVGIVSVGDVVKVLFERVCSENEQLLTYIHGAH